MSTTSDPKVLPDGEIRPGDTLPYILQRYPQVRPVLDRYGLSGCGGDSGPQESLSFFARMHGVDEETLLRELREAAAGAAPAPQTPFRLLQQAPEGPQPDLWRPFFAWAIAITLTAGATWGAVLLLGIARQRDFTSASLHWVNAHGHAQIFGWVGLFVMGFAYQAFPRFRQTTLWRPGWAVASLWLMLGGILARVAAETFLSGGAMLWVGVAGGVAEVAACLLFVANLVGTRRKTPGIPPQPMDFYLLSALFWFVAQSVYDVVYYAATVTAPDRETLIWRVAAFQAPLRDWQVQGFAMLMILGVSQRLLPGVFARVKVDAARAGRWIGPLNAGVLLSSVGFALALGTRQFAWLGVSYLGKLLLAVGVVMLTRGWGLFQRDPEAGRSAKYLQAAYGWLYLSLAMWVLSPLYIRLLDDPFSHAYYGAARHAITVGFISQMILGVAARAVPILSGRSAEGLGSLWMPFALLNLGCSLRVFGQVATDFVPAAFPITGVSGCFEVLALTLWALHLSPFLLPKLTWAHRLSTAVR